MLVGQGLTKIRETVKKIWEWTLDEIVPKRYNLWNTQEEKRVSYRCSFIFKQVHE